MQRIYTLLQKLNEVASQEQHGIIDIDLMLDYTRVMYADMLEWRSRVAFNSSVEGNVSGVEPQPQKHETEVPAPTEPVEVSNVALPTEMEVQGVTIAENTQEVLLQPVTTVVSEHDIRKLIGINDKYQFISELFGNDKEAYDNLVLHINSFDNYNDAIEWLDEEVHSFYKWNDDDITVQSFYAILSQFFVSR